MAAAGEEPGGGGKVGVAAAIGVLALTLSLTMAGTSAFLLWRGDLGDDMVNTLPANCDAAALVPAPKVLLPLTRALAQARLPTTWQPLAIDLARMVTATVPSGVQVEGEQSGFGVCFSGDTALVSAGLGPAGIDPLLADLARRAGGGTWRPSQPVGGFVEYQLQAEGGRPTAAMLAGERRVQFLLGGDDPSARLAGLVKTVQTTPMRGDAIVREAIERVGAGALQLVFGKAVVVAAADRYAAIPALGTLLREHARFLGVSLRDDLDDDRIHLHAHVGIPEGEAGERALLLLKRTLDAGTPRKTSAALRGADAGGVYRLSPAAWRGEGYGADALRALPSGTIWADWIAAAGGLAAVSAWDGTIVWALPGPHLALPAPFVALGLSGAANALEGAATGDGWLVFSPAGQSAAEAALAHLRANPGADPGGTEDRLRILDDTQGFFVDHTIEGRADGFGGVLLEAELIWLDTGLVAHLAIARPAEGGP